MHACSPACATDAARRYSGPDFNPEEFHGAFWSTATERDLPLDQGMTDLVEVSACHLESTCRRYLMSGLAARKRSFKRPSKGRSSSHPNHRWLMWRLPASSLLVLFP